MAILPFFKFMLPLYTLSLERKEYKHFWFYWIYGGIFAKMLGSYPVKRGLGNLELQLKDYVYFLGKGRTCLIFPEGSMTRSGKMYEDIKQGASFLAKKTGTLVVPMCICGAYKASFMDLLFGRRKITISIGKPFRYEGDSANEMFENVRRLGVPYNEV
jgi:1-acyl-sn-glycerol-3-phosphate acyltransferase